MTKEDIIRLARDAWMAEPYHPFNVWGANEEALERFAALVAAAERKACARLQYEIDQLKRENSILRSEFKIWLVNNNIENYDMSEDAAEEDAEKWLTHLVAHNEGAE